MVLYVPASLFHHQKSSLYLRVAWKKEEMILERFFIIALLHILKIQAEVAAGLFGISDQLGMLVYGKKGQARVFPEQIYKEDLRNNFHAFPF